jgi:hypothetical protein
MLFAVCGLVSEVTCFSSVLFAVCGLVSEVTCFSSVLFAASIRLIDFFTKNKYAGVINTYTHTQTDLIHELKEDGRSLSRYS